MNKKRWLKWKYCSQKFFFWNRVDFSPSLRAALTEIKSQVHNFQVQSQNCCPNSHLHVHRLREAGERVRPSDPSELIIRRSPDGPAPLLDQLHVCNVTPRNLSPPTFHLPRSAFNPLSHRLQSKLPLGWVRMRERDGGRGKETEGDERKRELTVSLRECASRIVNIWVCGQMFRAQHSAESFKAAARGDFT